MFFSPNWVFIFSVEVWCEQEFCAMAMARNSYFINTHKSWQYFWSISIIRDTDYCHNNRVNMPVSWLRSLAPDSAYFEYDVGEASHFFWYFILLMELYLFIFCVVAVVDQRRRLRHFLECVCYVNHNCTFAIICMSFMIIYTINCRKWETPSRTDEAISWFCTVSGIRIIEFSNTPSHSINTMIMNLGMSLCTICNE